MTLQDRLLQQANLYRTMIYLINRSRREYVHKSQKKRQVIHKACVARCNLTKFDAISWILDSGSTSHMTGDLNLLQNVKIMKRDHVICSGDSRSLSVKGRGEAKAG